MAHYYVDFTTPPPFGRSMPGAVGYFSKAGLQVLYGRKPKDPVVEKMIERAMAVKNEIPTRGWPDGDALGRFNAHIKATSYPRKKRRGPTGKPIAYQGLSKRPFECKACGVLTKACNRHHPMPLEIKYTKETVRLCFDCHSTAHQLPNPRLAEMTWKEQCDYILSQRFLMNSNPV